MREALVLIQADELAELVRRAVCDGVARALREAAGKKSDYLREAEAAQMIGVAAATLRAWRVQARGPEYCKLGGKVVYRRSELERFCQQGRVKTVESLEEPYREMRG